LKTRYGILIPIALLGILFLAGSASAAVDFPADEAGISAYVHARDSIDLNAAKSAFATIERETSDYIIGTVALDLHDEEEYPHVYVSKDGWIVAYYPKERPSSWIFPWADYNGGAITSTTLSKALGTISSKVGGTTTGLKYYDFRNPGASKMMLIVESATNAENYFMVTIPVSFSTYVVDWSHYNEDLGYSDDSFVYLNGAKVSSIASVTSANYGSFTGQFIGGTEQTIKIVAQANTIGRVGLVLEYAE
jgi:hypothetical protein